MAWTIYLAPETKIEWFFVCNFENIGQLEMYVSIFMSLSNQEDKKKKVVLWSLRNQTASVNNMV